jgi:RNA polymerase sigma factor (sigma-70 family)
MTTTLSPHRSPTTADRRLPGERVTALVNAAGAGDQRAWNALVRAFGPMIWAIAHAHRLRDADAADVSQATWLALLEHLGELKDPARLGAWLATTARRECLPVLRHKDRRVLFGDDCPEHESPDPSPCDELLVSERDAALWRSVERLRPSDQAPLRLHYRTHVAGEIFAKLDQYLWRLSYKWAVASHANKPTSWVIARYFGRFNKARQDRWVFGDRHSGSYMHRFAWTTIVRHQLVKQWASPDDPALADYWAERRRKPVLPINNTSLRLLKAQNGCCPICKTPLFATQPQTPSDWETWLTSTRTTTTIVKPVTGTPDTADHRLIHAQCNGPALLPAHQPSGLA